MQLSLIDVPEGETMLTTKQLSWANLEPRIGRLNSGKFYAFVEGYDKPEFVGTLEEVEIRLGLRQPASKKNRTVATKALRDYDVTVTPKIVTYSGGGWATGGQTFGAYTVRVSAHTSSEAIKKVRQGRNEEEVRYGVKATYRAKRV